MYVDHIGQTKKFFVIIGEGGGLGGGGVLPEMSVLFVCVCVCLCVCVCALVSVSVCMLGRTVLHG